MAKIVPINNTVESHLLKHDGEDLGGEDRLLQEANLDGLGNFPHLNHVQRTDVIVNDQCMMACALRVMLLFQATQGNRIWKN
jgi:hypothetical protein